MNKRSVYVVDCVCGARVENHEPAGTCKCGREFRVEWPADLPAVQEETHAR